MKGFGRASETCAQACNRRGTVCDSETTLADKDVDVAVASWPGRTVRRWLSNSCLPDGLLALAGLTHTTLPCVVDNPVDTRLRWAEYTNRVR